MTAKTLLKNQIDKFQIEIFELSREMGLIKCTMLCKESRLLVWIEDDFGDFDDNNPELNLLLALYSFESYHESKDILEWANETGISDLSPEVLAYYKSLGDSVKFLDSAGFNMEPPISYYDYHLGAGETESLRRK